MERSIQYIKRYYGTRLPGIYDSVSPLLVCFFFFCLTPPSSLGFYLILDILMKFLLTIGYIFFSWGGREGGRGGGFGVRGFGAGRQGVRGQRSEGGMEGGGVVEREGTEQDSFCPVGMLTAILPPPSQN